MCVESRKPPKRFGGGHRRGLEEARAELTERPGQRLLHQEHRHKIEQERHEHFVHPPAEMNCGRKGRPQRAEGRSAGEGGRDRQPPNSRPVRSMRRCSHANPSGKSPEDTRGQTFDVRPIDEVRF